MISASKSMQLVFDSTFRDRLTLAVTYCHFLNLYSISMSLFESTLKRMKNLLFSMWEIVTSTLFEYAIAFDRNFVRLFLNKLTCNYEKTLMHFADRRCLRSWLFDEKIKMHRRQNKLLTAKVYKIVDSKFSNSSKS